MQPLFRSAMAFSVEDLALLFTRSFEDYFYSLTMTPALLALRIRYEQVDLHHSVVMLDAAEQPIGIALLGVRARQAWCGGFGIVSAYRGQGLASLLIKELIAQVRAVGAFNFSLEVLVKNTRAIKAYQRAGLQIERDLHLFEWKQAQPLADAPPEGGRFTMMDPHELLHHFGRLHPVAPGWQRDLPSLLVRSDLQGLALIQDGSVCSYVLYIERNGQCVIQDIAAGTADDAGVLLQYLQRQFAHITSINEPANSPLAAAFTTVGFTEFDRQHELVSDF